MTPSEPNHLLLAPPHHHHIAGGASTYEVAGATRPVQNSLIRLCGSPPPGTRALWCGRGPHSKLKISQKDTSPFMCKGTGSP